MHEPAKGAWELKEQLTRARADRVKYWNLLT